MGPRGSGTRQLILDLGREPTFDADDFLVSASNAEAFRMIDRWPDWPARTALLMGPAGSGKSHLAVMWARYASARLVRAEDAIDPERLASHGVVLLEDCDRAGREADLFHLINLMKERGGWLLMTAQRDPNHWGVKTADLLSRLRLSPSVAIGKPAPEFVRAVLVKLFGDRQIRIDEEIVAYAALHLDQSLEAVRHFVAAVDEASLAAGRRITKPLAASTIALLQNDDLR